jgi:hypothetical protein
MGVTRSLVPPTSAAIDGPPSHPEGGAPRWVEQLHAPERMGLDPCFPGCDERLPAVRRQSETEATRRAQRSTRRDHVIARSSGSPTRLDSPGHASSPFGGHAATRVRGRHVVSGAAFAPVGRVDGAVRRTKATALRRQTLRMLHWARRVRAMAPGRDAHRRPLPPAGRSSSLGELGGGVQPASRDVRPGWGSGVCHHERARSIP